MDLPTGRPRQDTAIYIPAHRRTDSKDSNSTPGSPTSPTHDTSDIIKRGRGNFHSKPNGLSKSNSTEQPHSPRGRNFDATTLRTYPDSNKKSGGNDGSNLKKSGKSSSRRGSRLDGPKGNGIGATSQGSDDSDESKGLTDAVLDHAQNDATNVVSCNDPAVDNLANGLAEASLSSPTSPSSSEQLEDWELLLEKEPQTSHGNDENNTVSSQRRESNAGLKPRKRRASRIEILPEGAEAPTPDEPTFVLDCYDFPASFKTHHLHDIFREYENLRGGYRIKWLEDTRALIIFEHPTTAKKAYLDNVTNPLTKIRPYTGPISVKRTASPPRRPVTTDAVAKRLVAGALGVKVTKTPEQKAAEKAIFQTARDQREQLRNQATKRASDLDAAFNE